MQEIAHQLGSCQSGDDFCVVRGWLFSKEGAARAAEDRTWERKEACFCFSERGLFLCTCSQQRPQSRGPPPHKSEAIGRPPSSPAESLLKLISVLPLQAVGWYREGPSFMSECPAWHHVGPLAYSFLIFLPFPVADTNGGGQRGECLVRMTDLALMPEGSSGQGDLTSCHFRSHSPPSFLLSLCSSRMGSGREPVVTIGVFPQQTLPLTWMSTRLG